MTQSQLVQLVQVVSALQGFLSVSFCDDQILFSFPQVIDSSEEKRVEIRSHLGHSEQILCPVASVSTNLMFAHPVTE